MNNRNSSQSNNRRRKRTVTGNRIVPGMVHRGEKAGRSASDVRSRSSRSTRRKTSLPQSSRSSRNMRGVQNTARSGEYRSASYRQGSPRGDRTVQYRRPINLNLMMLVLALITIYMLVSVIRYLTRDYIARYEVRQGSLSTDSIYTGIALRSETVVNSDYTGNINYYNQEKDRLYNGELAYTIDETGEISAGLESAAANDSDFTDDDYSQFQENIIDYMAAFDPTSFSSVYDFKNTLQSSISNVSSKSVLSDIQSLAANSSSVHYGYTTDTGYIVYSTDGYETKTFDDLTADDFKTDHYKKTDIQNNELVESGHPAFKLETSEDWKIAIKLGSEDEAKKLTDMGVVKVRFLKNREESWGTVEKTRTDSEGNVYALLSFTNSMSVFCDQRLINIELLTAGQTGLKIPVTALVDDTFYIVPEEYMTKGAGGRDGVLKIVYNEDGNKSAEFVAAPPYSQDDDGNYYLGRDVLSAGDELQKPDSSDTYTVSKTAKLTGVYYVNEGYTDFREVKILEQNAEYAIIKSGTEYGLREYDYIVQDASRINPDDFLYE